ncbi:MAG TPA: hemerythrin domain-containing protein [Candidatus Saccharimonadales bacterium]|nr:hemerythrin domain-containing protein [Candidatus Saccharimonadales bacterium]
MKITEALIAEHAVFYAQLDHLEKTLPSTKTLAEIKACAALLECALKTHAKLEDDLFAVLEPSLDQLGKLETVRHDHEAIDTCLAMIKHANTRSEAQRILSRVAHVIRHEFDIEERILFPMAERLLRPETLLQLGKTWAARRDVRIG